MLHELDERMSDNLRVTLYWQDEDNTLTIEVEDLKRAGNDLTLAGVLPDERKQAFEHPYGYRPRKQVAAWA